MLFAGQAILKRHGSLLALGFSCPATIQMNPQMSPLDCFSQCIYCSARYSPRWKSFSQYIRLTPDLITTGSALCNKVHVMSFCLSDACNSATLFVWNAPACLSMGGQACWGFSHVQQQTAATVAVPAQEQTQYKHFKHVLTGNGLHALWCLTVDKRTLSYQLRKPKIWSAVCRALRWLLGYW